MTDCLSIGECMAELGPSGTDGTRRLGHGGDTLNTATYMARLIGPGKVGYATRLGDDPFSQEMVRAWQVEGLDTSLVELAPDRTVGLYAISVDEEGERSFTYWRDQAPARSLFMEGNTGALLEGIRAARLIFFSGITLAILCDEGRARLLAALGEARRAGAIVAYDPNQRPRLWPAPDEAAHWNAQAYQVAGTLLSSMEEEIGIFGDGEVAARGPEEIILKNGEGPCRLIDGGQVSEIAPPEAVRPMDTTGAGDAFNAAYLSARLAGCSPEASVLEGHGLAGIVVQHRGAIIDPSNMPH